VRRIQIHLDEVLDDALEAEAARRGVSKAALIREGMTRQLGPVVSEPEDPWQAIAGWLDDDPVDDIDEVIYGPTR
jgi:hypothetical protein